MSNSEQSATVNNAITSSSNNTDNNNSTVASTSVTTIITTPVMSTPIVGSGLELDGEVLPKYRRDLVAKQKILRAELTALQPQSGHCRLEVSRNEIFEVRKTFACYLIE